MALLPIFYPSLLSQLDNAFASYPDILAGLKANDADMVWKAMEKYAVQALEGRFGTSSDLVILVKVMLMPAELITDILII